MGGEAGYTGGFVEHYVMPVLYPEGLTRTVQIGFALFALSVNLVVYLWILSRWRARHDA